MAYNAYKHYRLMVIVISLILSFASGLFLTVALDDGSLAVTILIYELLCLLWVKLGTVNAPADEELSRLLCQARSDFSEADQKAGLADYMKVKTQVDYQGLSMPLAFLIGAVFLSGAISMSGKFAGLGTVAAILVMFFLFLNIQIKESKAVNAFFSTVNDCRFSALFCAVGSAFLPEFALQHRHTRKYLREFMAVDYACLCLFWESKEQEALTILDRAWELQARKTPAMEVSYHSLRSTLIGYDHHDEQLQELDALKEAAEKLPKLNRKQKELYQSAIENHTHKTMMLEGRWEEILADCEGAPEKQSTPLDVLNFSYTGYRAAKALGREDLAKTYQAAIWKYAPNKTL